MIYSKLILKLKILTGICFGILVLSSSCEIFNDDNVDENPCTRIEEEISPDDKFACKVNGKIWRQTNTDFFAEVLPDWSHIYGDAERDLKNCDDFPSRISLHVKNPIIGDNLLSAIDWNYCPVDSSTCIFCYDIDTTLNRTITFSELDLEERIANGTFSFQAVNEECEDTVNITEGVFNLRW